MEIERKWMVEGWPGVSLPLVKEEEMRQGYVSVRPTVRIREENVIRSNAPDIPVGDHYVLCFKSQGTLARREIEMELCGEQFAQLEDLIGLPLIPKLRRTYALPDGLYLEVNHVDEGLPTEFWYAEVEYPAVEAAIAWDPASAGLADYLTREVTSEPGQSMGAYWEQTRLQNGSRG